MRAALDDGRTLRDIPAKAVTSDQEAAVRRLVASRAEHSDDARALLQMLGIPDPRPAKSGGTPKRRKANT
ncbi:hypothetical protein [Nocardia abscessus]|uniref:hypothetical protein n=1 Tax=Nocardia abscessus TaxID=120957 RepID=UPI0024584BE8|nr:hypothetical protein [Nocardia abscessus]